MKGKKGKNEVIIGAIVILVLALVYFGISFLRGVNLFSSQTRYYAVYTDIGGLEVSSPVIINGYKIGIVKNIQLEKSGSGRLVVELILNDAEVNIPSDSKLKIYDSDLFGGKAIQIVFGESSTFAQSGDTLIGQMELGLTETLKKEIEPIKLKTGKLFSDIDSVLTVVQSTLENSGAEGLPGMFGSLQKTLANLENTTRNLDELVGANSGKVGEILANAESISNNLKNNNDKINRAVNNISQFSDTLAKVKLAATVIKVEQAMSHFEATIQKANNGEGSLGKLLNNDSLYNELNHASHSLDLLLDDMRNHPKNYVGFSLFGRKDSEKFSKSELEDLRKIIDELLKEKEKEKKN